MVLHSSLKPHLFTAAAAEMEKVLSPSSPSLVFLTAIILRKGYYFILMLYMHLYYIALIYVLAFYIPPVIV